MFLDKLEFIFLPFRNLYNRWIGVKNIKGNIEQEGKRAKAIAQCGKGYAQDVNKFNQKLNAQVPGQEGANMQGQPPGTPGAQGAPGMPAANVPNPNPPIRSKGFWIFKKKFCTQCEQQLDKSWDACPYCAQIAQQIVAAPGGASSMQLLGWIVPLQGPQKGELFTLAPVTSIGTDPKSTVVLNDKFMSSKHAEIKAENGMWVLRDAGSTNGTYVNNKRVDRHELVDNDFVKFGSAMLKFKSL